MNTLAPLSLSSTTSVRSPTRRPRWLVQLLNYEYWPFYVFFAPMIGYFAYLALRSRSLTFFTVVNPAIPLGGLFGESKGAILDSVPAAFRPQTLLFDTKTSAEQVLDQMVQWGLSFPVVCKPNVGERGRGVGVVASKIELIHWLSVNGNEPFLVQEWVAGPLEFGVFYYKLPDGSASGVTSVVQKEFLTVQGDGLSTVCELLRENERARMTWNELLPVLDTLGERVPANGERVLVQPIGNHCRGTMFLNANYLCSASLDRVFNRIGGPMTGFDYGRFDIRVPSVADLLAGRNIRVLEVNGISSEPGHVYDPAYSLRQAYIDIGYHLRLLHRISQQRRRAGASVASVRTVWQCLKTRFGN